MGNILLDDLRHFIQSLNEAEVAYLIVGGYAVILNGHCRTTGGLDVWIKPTEENHKRMAAAFLSFGLPIEMIPLQKFLDTESLDVFSFGRNPVGLDIMTAVKGLEFDECYSQSKVFEVQGIEIRAIQLPDLIVAKKAAGRHKDLDDLEHLEGRKSQDE